MEFCKLGGIGASEVGKLFTSQGLRSKSAQTLAYEKAIELVTGHRKESLTTIPMLHGLENEQQAYKYIIKPNFENACYQSDKSYKIVDRFWATPDIVDKQQQIVFDIKCPFGIYSFFAHILNPKPIYLVQIQTQMLALGYTKGYLLYYLTSNRTDPYGNKIEYDIPINDRHFLLEVKQDPELQQEIKKRVTEFLPMVDTLYNHLQGCGCIEDAELFKLSKSKRVTRLKDKSNLLGWQGKIYSSQSEGYLVIE